MFWQKISSAIKEFFGFGGYTREPEGYLSWQHLTFVTLLMVLMVTLAVVLGRAYRKRDDAGRNKVLIFAAILIDSLELFKIVMLCIITDNPLNWLHDLPLFLCSIQLIAIPLAAFTAGKLKNASLDFVFIFGVLGAVCGTYFAGQNYNAYPVLSFDNVVSGLTHCISGFASLYIAISGMVSMKKKNIRFTFAILSGFCATAYVVNHVIDYNYMFLMRGDGTPYDIFFNLVNGSPVLYPLIVWGLFVLYIGVFYSVYYLFAKKRKKDPHSA